LLTASNWTLAGSRPAALAALSIRLAMAEMLSARVDMDRRRRL
jgi:hypothetical protein